MKWMRIYMMRLKSKLFFNKLSMLYEAKYLELQLKNMTKFILLHSKMASLMIQAKKNKFKILLKNSISKNIDFG